MQGTFRGLLVGQSRPDAATGRLATPLGGDGGGGEDYYGEADHATQQRMHISSVTRDRLRLEGAMGPSEQGMELEPDTGAIPDIHMDAR
jgi:hypothetical protein